METKKRLSPFGLTLAILLTVGILLTPFAVAIGVFLGLPSVYTKTFYGELDNKYDLLYGTEEPKIVIIGGSSVAFGYDSEKLSQAMGMPVVNFGLYAEFGTKLMLDLAEDAIGAGDIVLIAPEMDAQTLSLYFSGSATMKALDEDPRMLRSIKRENYSSLWGALWSFTAEKLGYLRTGKPDPASAYNGRNFNAYGDFVYTVTKTIDGVEVATDGRAENIMDGYFDQSTPIIPDKKIVSADFLDYLNAYIDRIKGKGATVYFTYCPMNAMAVTVEGEDGSETPLATDALTFDVDVTKETITGVELSDDVAARCAKFNRYLTRNLHCDLLGEFTDFVYPPNYFYDTNFHLNTTGVAWHTAQVGNLLYQAVTGTDVEPIAKMSRLPTLYITLADMDATYAVGDLIYQMTLTETFTVVGVSEEGKTKETIVLPTEITVHDAKLDLDLTCPVASISSEAFAGTTVLQTLVVSDQAKMSAIYARAFADSSVRQIYLFCPVEGFLAGKNMLSGSVDGFKIWVGANLGYETDYSWGEINEEGQPKILDVTDKVFSDFNE